MLSPPEAIAMDEEVRELRRSLYAKGLRAHSATAPVFRLTGPLPPSILPDYLVQSDHHVLGRGRRHFC